jgi:magnesium transporter
MNKNLPDTLRLFRDQNADAEKATNASLESLKRDLFQLTPIDIVEGWMQIEESERPVVFRLLNKTIAATVFDMLEPLMQSELIESLTGDETAALFAALDPDDRVALLDEVPARVAKKLLDMLSADQKELTKSLLGYADGTVGRLMNPVFIDVKKSMTVKEAMQRIRTRAKEDQHFSNVYVTDPTRKLEAVIPLSVLVRADEDTRVEALAKGHTFVAVTTGEDEERAARLLQDSDTVELPVLDKESRLVGVFSADDAMDVLREENTDDMFDKIGLLDVNKRETDRSYNLLHGSFWHVLRVRVPFLLITLAGGMLAGLVIDEFEDILGALVATAIFIPVIMDMGGNVGTQSSTIFTRGLVLGQIDMKRFFKAWRKETLNGFGMAIVLGALGGLIAGVWQGIPELGYAVGISLTLVITLGVALGFVIPYLLIKMGFDQAAGADPIITTIKDMAGLVIYFYMVQLLLPDLVEDIEEVAEVAHAIGLF